MGDPAGPISWHSARLDGTSPAIKDEEIALLTQTRDLLLSRQKVGIDFLTL
jgi:hypothetical protein